MKLRKARQLFDKADRADCDTDVARVVSVRGEKWTLLPQLRTERSTKYFDNDGYSKHLNRMIAKHGPDADFPVDRNGGRNDDGGLRPTAGNDQKECDGTDRKPGGIQTPPVRRKVSRRSGPSILDDILSGNNRGFGPPVVGDNPRLQPGEGFPNTDSKSEVICDGGTPGQGRSVIPKPSRETPNTDQNGDKFGVATQTDARPTGTSLLECLKRFAQTEGGMRPHPHSFSSEVLSQPSMTATECINMEKGELSTECRHQHGNPGGFVDEAFAKLESKHLKREAASIAREFDAIFRANEVSSTGKETPRIKASKLIREIVSSAFRMSRTRREEYSHGIKLVLVDISPSCASIRDQCLAAALSIADKDDNVIVITHFNGWMAQDSDAEINERSGFYGYRVSELPRIEPGESYESSTAKMEEFLGTGAVSGCIAFGDFDAALLYGMISQFTPTIWMNPRACGHGEMEQYKPQTIEFPEAGLIPIEGVYDARTAVAGLRQKGQDGKN